jgi:hypothetical protein
VSSPPPEPAKPWDAQLVGTFKVKYVQLQSNVAGTTKTEKRTWLMDPRCAEGPCDVKVRSVREAKWKAVALFLSNRGTYRWVRRFQAFTCTVGSTERSLPSVSEYSIRPMSVVLDEDRWIVEKFEGTLDQESLENCGFIGTAKERYAIRGTLAA